VKVGKMRGGLRTNGLEIEVITTILIGLARISVDEDLEVLLGSWEGENRQPSRRKRTMRSVDGP
jgi:hypothetical protein